MNSEILVVLILIAVAALFIFWIRSKDRAGREPDRVDDGVKDTENRNRSACYDGNGRRVAPPI
jgi:hypothetical protein